MLLCIQLKMGNTQASSSCDQAFYRSYAYEQFDLLNYGWYLLFYNAFQYWAVSSQIIPLFMPLADYFKYTYQGYQEMEAEGLARKYYSQQEQWNVLNFGFLFDYGLFVCGFAQIFYGSFHWIYLLLIDPYWYIYFTKDYANFEKERKQKQEENDAKSKENWAKLFNIKF